MMQSGHKNQSHDAEQELNLEPTGFSHIILFITLLLMTELVFASSSIDDYMHRLQEAQKISEGLIEEDFPARTVISGLKSIRRLLPSQENIDRGGLNIRVDNSWLHEAIDKVIQNANGDIEQRHSMLTEIKLRITNLYGRVKEGTLPQAAEDKDARSRIETILARPEYRPQELQESSIRQWARMLNDLIAELLKKLFGTSSSRRSTGPGGGGATFFRIVILLATAAGLLFGLYKLTRFHRSKKKTEDGSEMREVLGEEIAADVTAADLLAKATELARRGEYRTAIRRAYIALLFELDQRGKLHLDRSKTNRDYLNALRTDRQIFPGFSSMTGTFEHVWYGQGWATEDEFNHFVAKYRETTKVG